MAHSSVSKQLHGSSRRISFGFLACLFTALTGCAVVPGERVVYEDARGYAREPDVVIIDHGPAVRWPYRYGHRHYWRDYHHRPHRSERHRGRSRWEGRDGRRDSLPDRGRNRPQMRPGPRQELAVPVIPHKNTRRSEFSGRRDSEHGRTRTNRGTPRSGPAEGESS